MTLRSQTKQVDERLKHEKQLKLKYALKMINFKLLCAFKQWQHQSKFLKELLLNEKAKVRAVYFDGLKETENNIKLKRNAILSANRHIKEVSLSLPNVLLGL